ncbi:hypothetical protein AQUCO_03400070v1 [Aquilegia coerulea]|uniref:Nuclear condensin complex subunit 3 C-terminal domain-containing protein n=1 Tax=Aquilegia coerulea TaxID=218851 RepID=A0A2G5CXD1_AQUCA|nr:hypothetical protein AQUCO_03400070v1 [Aquilegia coerulea]
MANNEEEEESLMEKIAKVLDETSSTNAIHNRKLKELSTLRSSSSYRLFFSAFSKTLKPLFNFQRRNSSSARIVRFISIFAAHRDDKNGTICDQFLDDFVRFLLIASAASNKTARLRSCQIISEIIMRLPDDAEVSDELWDDVIELMKVRVADKVPMIRTYAVHALARFANDTENNDIVDLFLQALPLESNAEVRKTIILSFPPSSETLTTIIGCTLDVHEAVRKASYCVLANKFPLQSLSIKHRTIILQRGLADRSLSVSKECLKLMKDNWLVKCCKNDPVVLLHFLDVETYESVGEAVMASLLKDGMVEVREDKSIRQFIESSRRDTNEGKSPSGEHTQSSMLEPEVVFYWRTVCKHLQSEAQSHDEDWLSLWSTLVAVLYIHKGQKAYCETEPQVSTWITSGTEAAVYAEEAFDKNDLLEKVLPATVYDYVELVKLHLDAGPNYRFTARQLLLLGVMLDFSDATSRKTASAFLQELLHRPLEHEVDEDGNQYIIGDGIHLGGERDWALSVSELAKKVHASAGEFEEMVIGVVEELARPCRDRTADFMQWMHCLAVTGLLLENVNSSRRLQTRAMKPSELLHCLLLPGANHVHLDVKRVAVRCLGLFGLLERKPSEELVKQLRLSFVDGPSSVSVMATKALADLAMWHGPHEVDKAMGYDMLSEPNIDKKQFPPINFSDSNGHLDCELVDLLFAGLDRDYWGEVTETDDNESVQAIVGEGFAKALLLSDKYSSISASLQPVILAKLVTLYFGNETEDLFRLRQCLSVFFEHYPTISANHKKYISKAFIPVMRSIWPGIYGNAGGSPILISRLRKRAAQASRFMLQMMQSPLYSKETQMEDRSGSRESQESADNSGQLSGGFEYGEEGLAIHIATEVVCFPTKKTAAGKAYMSGLCKIAVLLHFRSSEQAAIKFMRGLLNRVIESVSADKEVVKDLKFVAARLEALDECPDQALSQDQADLIAGRLELEEPLGMDDLTSELQTPAQRSVRPTRSRRRVRHEEVSSDESETSPSTVLATPSLISTRSQRASKTAALSKMTAKRDVIIEEEYEEDGNQEEVSDLSSEDESDVYAE